MIPQEPPEKKEPVFTIPGKNIVITGIVLFVIIVWGVLFFMSPGVVENSPHNSIPQPVRQSNPQPALTSTVKPVDFVIDPGPQEKCGLTCRQLTPAITNSGSETAHNVCISITLYNSRGDLISLNGGPSIKKCIGDIAQGESKSEPIVIEADCGFLASKCIQQTLVLKTKVTCDEATVQFPDRTIAV